MDNESENKPRLPFNLPPKSMAVVTGFVLIYDILMSFLGYKNISLLGIIALFAFGAGVILYHRNKDNIKKNLKAIKQFWKDLRLL